MPSHGTTLTPLAGDVGYLDLPGVSTSDTDRLRLAIAGFLAARRAY